MAANLVEKLQEAIKACEEIPVKDLNAQKQQIAEQFKELQKAVFEIVDEKTIILSTLKWKQTKTIVCTTFLNVLQAEARRIALQYGYSYETIYEMLKIKNDFSHEEICLTARLFSESKYSYTYWTLE